jgi:hypothetical protein
VVKKNDVKNSVGEKKRREKKSAWEGKTEARRRAAGALVGCLPRKGSGTI